MRTSLKIGCEAWIVRDNQVLLGKRRGTAGSGTWALPGGHLEFMERADECLVRELKEEMDLTVKLSDLKLLAVTDDLSPDTANHYVHLTFQTEIGGQEPKLCEPEECEEWKWFGVDKLPANIFPPHAKILRTIKSQKIYLPE